MAPAPEITLYTAHHCPFAHRAQIAPRELELHFDTVLIDITRPRDPEYLAVNPRGLVPALAHLLPPSSDTVGAVQRFRIGYFIDTYFGKVHPFFDAAVQSRGQAEAVAASKYIDAVIQHMEPLLADAAPFFGGFNRLTLAEVQIGSFLLRVFTLPKHEDMAPSFILQSLEERAPRFWRWGHAVIAEQSVTSVWDEDNVVQRTLEKIAKMRKEQATV